MKDTIIFFPFSSFNLDLFNNNISSNEISYSNPFFYIKKELERIGFKIKINDINADISSIYACVILRKLNKKELKFIRMSPKNILYIFEPKVVDKKMYEFAKLKTFNKVYTFDDDLIKNKRFSKFYYPNPDIDKFPKINEKSKLKTVCLISANKCSSNDGELYSLRRKAITFFDGFDNYFDLYGKGFDQNIVSCFGDNILQRILRRLFLRNHQNFLINNYRGIAKNKIETVSRYKYSFVTENSKAQKGYITEKIFDSFIAGTIPIYFGPENITDYIPQNCFIDFRKFDSLYSLKSYIDQISTKEYNYFLDNIIRFLYSNRYEKFTQSSFVKSFMLDFL